MNRIVICQYCMRPAKFMDSAPLYGGKSYGMVWACLPCQAWVGVHKGDPNSKPLGKLANKELRIAKMMAHAAFDPLWKSGRMTRTEAYQHLSSLLGVPKEEAHIGMFNVPQCMQVVKLLQQESEHMQKPKTRSALPIVGDEYRISECDCGIPPWEFCKHSFRAAA